MDRVDNTTTQFAFITICDGDSIKDPARQQQARTQAIKHSLQRKRRRLELSSRNFVDQTPSLVAKRKPREKEAEEPPVRLPQRSASFGVQSIDPFDTLAVNADRLTKLYVYYSGIWWLDTGGQFIWTEKQSHASYQTLIPFSAY